MKLKEPDSYVSEEVEALTKGDQKAITALHSGSYPVTKR